MDNKQLFLSGLVGALVMVVLSNVPVLNLINCLICAGLWLGGMAAVWFYRRQTAQTLTAGQGAIIGVVAGVIGAVLSAIAASVFGADAMQAVMDADPTGQTRSVLGGFIGGTASFLVSLLINIILYPLFGAVGGAIYAALTGRPPASKVG
jgi:hypothetical protein